MCDFPPKSLHILLKHIEMQTQWSDGDYVLTTAIIVLAERLDTWRVDHLSVKQGR